MTPSLASQSASPFGVPSGLMARGCLSLSSIAPGPRKTPSSRLNPWKTKTPFCSLQKSPILTFLSTYEPLPRMHSLPYRGMVRRPPPLIGCQEIFGQPLARTQPRDHDLDIDVRPHSAGADEVVG